VKRSCWRIEVVSTGIVARETSQPQIIQGIGAALAFGSYMVKGQFLGGEVTFAVPTAQTMNINEARFSSSFLFRSHVEFPLLRI
jgi:hypothetical protein